MTVGQHPNEFVRLWPHLPWPPPTDHDDASWAISKQVWNLADIHSIAAAQVADESKNLVRTATRDCANNMQDLSLSPRDIAVRLLELDEHNYHKSLWCKQSHKEGVPLREEKLWLPCDAYRLRRRERTPENRWEGNVEYYFKLCLTPMKTVVMLVSIHL